MLLPEKNGDNSWVLPIPATYVIDTDGIIAMAFDDVDYRNLLDPAEIVIALESLSKEKKGGGRPLISRGEAAHGRSTSRQGAVGKRVAS
jgi:hypothetical protein